MCAVHTAEVKDYASVDAVCACERRVPTGLDSKGTCWQPRGCLRRQDCYGGGYFCGVNGLNDALGR